MSGHPGVLKHSLGMRKALQHCATKNLVSVHMKNVLFNIYICVGADIPFVLIKEHEKYPSEASVPSLSSMPTELVGESIFKYKSRMIVSVLLVLKHAFH